MRIGLSDRSIKVFTVMPRTRDKARYVQDLTNLADWSEAHGSTGILLFLGNDTLIDPWLSACAVMARTRELQPLIAVNPVYMHPFTAARMVSSLALLFERKLYINLISGTSVSDLSSLGDRLQHDERYERLREYAELMQLLLTQRRQVSFQGRYYQVQDLQLLPALSPDLQPGFLLAGQSSAALALARSVRAETLQMLSPKLEGPREGEGGVYFGMISRADRDTAVRAACTHFPSDDAGREIARRAMKVTDAVWKRRLWNDDESEEITAQGYWLGPFKSFQADCPYVVRDRAAMSDLIVKLIRQATTTFVIDTPVAEVELQEIAAAFASARDKLRRDAHD